MRTICMARETGAAITLGTARKESRHGPLSSGGSAMGVAGGISGGGACATADVKEVRRNAKDRIMHALFA